jgi:TM2 domain-containing membrane protein YozV
MRFQVPQFIGVEDKIFGPLTIRQFIYLAGGAGIIVILFNTGFIPTFIAVILSVPVALFSLALAFYKYDQYKPFIEVVENAFTFYLRDKLYLWKKEEHKPVHQEATEDDASLYIPKLGDSKLRDMNWSLDANKK